MSTEGNDKGHSKSGARPGPKTSERSKVVFQEEDPLSNLSQGEIIYENFPKVKKENLTIRLEDEARIVAGMSSAAKKQTTGAIFSVVVDISRMGTLGIGVKDLSDNILAVSMLKRENNQPGPGEEAGIRLGDIIFGINFVPTREGSRTLINVIKKETSKQRKILHIQGWRCHQLCSDNIPGYLFPRADEVIVQAYSLFRTKVFSDWERWNFIEILLGHMIEDLKLRTSQSIVSSAGISSSSIDETGRHISSQSRVRAKQMQVLDLERNILQAKGLRTAMCVRIVHTKSQNDTVIYVLRVEDVESGLQWVVHRRFRDFFALNEELLDMSHFAKEVEFPRKRISIRNTNKLVENRIVALEQYVRKTLHILTLYATMDSAASRSLRHLQNFLGVDRYVDCVHPPLVDDQRYIELMAYRFLNDFSSPACQQCVRFITTIDLDSIVETGPEGYRAVLALVKDALTEVEQFVQQQHQQQMIQTLRDRRPDLDPEQLRSFVRKCVRRQVEAALYLPLRRNVFRIVYSFVAQKSKQMQRSMTLLQQATPNYLMVDAYVQQAKALPAAVKAFRRVIQAYLPADQGQLLIEAAGTVTELHRECHLEKQRLKALEANNNVNRVEDSAGPSRARSSGEFKAQSSGNKSPRASGSLENRPQQSNAHPTSVSVLTDVMGKLRSVSQEAKEGRARSVSDLRNGGSPTNINTGATTKRNSIGGFFRSKSSSLSSPTPTGVTATGSHQSAFSGGAVDLVGKEAMADPAGVIFQSDEVPDLYSTPRNGEEPTGHFEDDDVEEDASRVSFSVSPGPPLDGITTPPKRTVSVQNSSNRNNPNSNNNAEFISPVNSAITTGSNTPSAELLRASSLHTFDARSQQNLDLLNTAIFDHQQRNPLSSDSTLQTDSESVGQSGSDITGSSNELSQHQSRLQRHKSIKINSLLNDILDMNVSAAQSKTATDIATKRNDNITDGDTQCSNGITASDSSTSAENVSSGLDANSSETTTDAETRQQAQQQQLETSLLFADIVDMAETAAVEIEGSVIVNNTTEVQQHDVISADDFLPLFTFVLVQAGLPQLLLVKELMVTLVDDEDAYGECGYYLATLEAATQHICDLAEQYEKVAKVDSLFDDGEDIFEQFNGEK